MKPPYRSTRVNRAKLRELLTKHKERDNDSDCTYVNESSEIDESAESDERSESSEPDEESTLDEGGDFDLDTSTVKPLLMKKLRRELKAQGITMSKKDVETIADEFLNSSSSNILEEYCGNKPADKRWKIGLKRDRVEELEPILKRCRIDIDSERPTMERILSANILESKRREAIKLFDVMENTEPYTQYRNEIERKILDLITPSVKDISAVKELEEYDTYIRKEFADTSNDMRTRIFQLNTTDEIRATIYKRYLKLEEMEPTTTSYSTEKEWLRWAVSLPYNNEVKEEENMSEIRKSLDDELFGMEEIKERIMEIINDRRTSKDNRGAQLGLCGKPGCGKTSIAEATARALKVPFEKINLAGMEDASLLKGTDNAWVGASPSILLKCMCRMGSSRGVVLFDEIDKLKGHRSEAVENALLHITDYSHNHAFRDTFLCDFPHDLSKLWFFYAMNDTTTINRILLDRMSVMNVKTYTTTELETIVRGYVLPKALKNVGMEVGDVKLDSTALRALRGVACEESSVRTYEKLISSLVSKVNMLRTNAQLVKEGKTPIKVSYSIEGFSIPIVLTDKNIRELMERDTISEAVMSMYI